MFYIIALLSHRAKTHDCKSEIVRLACLSQEEMYPSELVNTCPMLKSASFEKDSSHLGCFKDSFNDRILKVRFMNRQAVFLYQPIHITVTLFTGENAVSKSYQLKASMFRGLLNLGLPFCWGSGRPFVYVSKPLGTE